MKIAFVLPRRSPGPVGGFKVVYEYANRLAERGHELSVVHPWAGAPPSSAKEKLVTRLGIQWSRRRRAAVVPWFGIDPRVRLPVVARLDPDELPAVDALVATAWQTAEAVAAASPEKGRGFYLVQGYETWSGDADAVKETWRLPLRKIVISRWLEEIAVELGEGSRTSFVPNGLDLGRWGVDLPIEAREPRIGAVLSHYKGREDLVAALSLARARLPGLSAATFGTVNRPADLPEWVDHVRLPDSATLRALYNSCSIFLQASKSEGWGLPAAEAMACGCALVTYDTGGSREYAIDGETARVTERGAGNLAAAVVELVADRDARLQLSRRGREKVEGFTWPRSVDAIERVLEGAEGER